MRGSRTMTWAWMVVAVAFSGCAQNPTIDTSPPGNIEGLLLGTASGLPTDPRVGASLAAPPEWRLGEWWRTEFLAPPYGISASFTQVVAGVDGPAYLLGVNAEDFNDGVLLLHFPGLGEIQSDTLGFDAHDRPFVPLKFPLQVGATWDTQWYTGAPLKGTVVRVTDTTAEVELIGVRTIQLTYDADLGTISRFVISDYGGYAVTDHGFGYSGTVRVPAGQDLVFCHGRSTVVQVIKNCQNLDPTSPAPPMETIQLAATYDRVSFGLFLRDLQAAPVAPGILHIKVVAPDGHTYEATKAPDKPGMVLYPYGLGKPGGTWEVTALALGDGLAILEGVAYNVHDVQLVLQT